MLNISAVRHWKHQHGSKLTQSPFEHSALILVPNPRRWLNVREESNRGKELVGGRCTASSDQLGEPKTEGLFHVWLNRCNCVSCSVVFPLVLSASPSPLWEKKCQRIKTSDRCCLSSASVLIIFHKTEDEFLPKTELWMSRRSYRSRMFF